MKPTLSDWNGIKRVFRYLKGTKGLGIIYQSNNKSLKIYSDADYANDVETRRSQTGMVAVLSGGAIAWLSQLQKSVATSTMHAETKAACEGAKLSRWLVLLLSELQREKQPAPTLYIDNMSAVKIAKNPEGHQRSKQFEVEDFYVRELVAEGKLIVQHIPGAEQPADIFTKALARVKFQKFRKDIGILN